MISCFNFFRFKCFKTNLIRLLLSYTRDKEGGLIVSKKQKKKNHRVDDTKLERNVIIAEVEFPSARIMLDILLGEYQYEFSRKASMETRAGVILAFIGSIILLLPTILGKPELIQVDDSCFAVVLKVVTMIIYTLTYILLVLAISQIFKTLKTRDYSNFDLGPFTAENARKSDDVIAKALLVGLKDIVESNSKVNELKASYYQNAIRFILAGFVSITIYVVVSVLV